MGRWKSMVERAEELAVIDPESGEHKNKIEVTQILVREFEASEAAAWNAAGVGATNKRKAMGIGMRGQDRNVDPVWKGGRPRANNEQETNMANDPNFWDDSKGLLTLQQVSQLLNVSRETVRKWAGDGTLPVLNLGSQGGAGRSSIPRFKRSAIYKFLQSREQGGS